MKNKFGIIIMVLVLVLANVSGCGNNEVTEDAEGAEIALEVSEGNNSTEVNDVDILEEIVNDKTIGWTDFWVKIDGQEVILGETTALDMQNKGFTVVEETGGAKSLETDDTKVLVGSVSSSTHCELDQFTIESASIYDEGWGLSENELNISGITSESELEDIVKTFGIPQSFSSQEEIDESSYDYWEYYEITGEMFVNVHVGIRYRNNGRQADIIQLSVSKLGNGNVDTSHIDEITMSEDEFKEIHSSLMESISEEQETVLPEEIVEEDNTPYEYIDAPIYQKVTKEEAQEICKVVLESGAQKTIKLDMFDSVTIDGITYDMDGYENGDVINFMVELNKQLPIDLGNGKKKNQSYSDFLNALGDDEYGLEEEFIYYFDDEEDSQNNYLCIKFDEGNYGNYVNEQDFLVCEMEIVCTNCLNKVYINFDEEQLSVTLEGTSGTYEEVYFGNNSEIYQASLKGLKEDSTLLESINDRKFPDITVNGERMCPFRELETAKEYVNIVLPQENYMYPDVLKEDFWDFQGWYGLHEDGTPCKGIIYKYLLTANTSGLFMDRAVLDGIWLLPGYCEGCTNDIRINGVSITDDLYVSEFLPEVDVFGNAKLDKKDYLTRDSIEIKEYPGKFEITYEVDSEKIYMISHILGEGFLNDIAQRDDKCDSNQMGRFLKEQYTEFYNEP